MSLCTQCETRPIDNKHFKLCWLCNKKRLDEKKRINSSDTTSRSKTIRTRASNTGRANKRIIQTTKALQKSSFREEIFSKRPNICTGCHKSNGLTISHTIPVGLRKDLEFNSFNVELECMDCHTKWEHGTLETQKALLNFQSKINWIKLIDPEYYERRFKE